VQILKNKIKNSFYKGIGVLIPYKTPLRVVFSTWDSIISFKKHKSMHVCNHVTKVTKISTWQFNKMVKLFEEEIHIMQLFYANQSIRNVRDISNAIHDRPIPSIGTIFNIISKSLVFGKVGCIATHNALICVC
jgi:hypothetical protein